MDFPYWLINREINIDCFKYIYSMSVLATFTMSIVILSNINLAQNCLDIMLKYLFTS